MGLLKQRSWRMLAYRLDLALGCRLRRSSAVSATSTVRRTLADLIASFVTQPNNAEMDVKNIPYLPTSLVVEFEFSGGLDEGECLRSDAAGLDLMRFMFDWALSDGGRVGSLFTRISEGSLLAAIEAAKSDGTDARAEAKQTVAAQLDGPHRHTYKVVDRQEIGGKLKIRCEYRDMLDTSEPVTVAMK